MTIDPSSPIPIYKQIVDEIRRSVAAGVYRPGEMIPSLRALALELAVNPNTVQRAYEALEREGLIHARKGLGMFVAEGGVASAQSKSEAAVYASFAEGIRAGQAANMSRKHIRTTFNKASDDHNTRTASTERAQSKGASSRVRTRK